MKKLYFDEQLTKIINEENMLIKKFNIMSSLRFITFLFSLSGFAIGLYNKNTIAFILGFIFLIIFLIFIYIHNNIENKKIYIQSKKLVLLSYIERFDNKWKQFKENGAEYLNEKIPQSKDLDLFGHASLYQYICTAHTPYGKEFLSNALLNSNLNINDILKNQKAIKELSNKLEFCIDIQSLSNLLEKNMLKKEEWENFFKYGKSKSNMSNLTINLCAYFPILLNIVMGILFLIDKIPIYLFYSTILIQIGIAIFGGIKSSEIFKIIFSFKNSITQYQKIFLALENENFESDYLKQLQKDLIINSGASKAVYKLNFIVEMINLKYSPMIYLFVAIIFMWDYQCINLLEHWKKLYGVNIESWIKTIGKIEMLISLCTICITKENFCFPDVIEDNIPQLNIHQIGHPLIEEKNVVYNSINLKSQSCIITGSNMSGKTTFMRSIGVNMILCYAGAPVCAEYFKTSCMSIFTSMRIQDDVSQGISTFYAEILRIKSMIQYSHQRYPMIVLIDEIFKGTNSADRIIGAKEVIKKLSQEWIISIVSTHDFELCDLEKDNLIKVLNYHFEEYYTDDEIHFDYKIKPGQCTTTNAKQLMHMAGIL